MSNVSMLLGPPPIHRRMTFLAFPSRGDCDSAARIRGSDRPKSDKPPTFRSERRVTPPQVADDMVPRLSILESPSGGLRPPLALMVHYKLAAIEQRPQQVLDRFLPRRDRLDVLSGRLALGPRRQSREG